MNAIQPSQPKTPRGRSFLNLAMLVALVRCAPVDLLNATVSRSGVIISRNIAYGAGPRQRLDVYRPVNAKDLPTVVFFYGGSWRGGSKSMYPFVAATMARAGAVVIVPDYRIYPQVTYPDFLRDCAASVAWAQAHGPEFGGQTRVFLMGHSAGAYNAAMLGLDTAWLREAGADSASIAGVIGLAGPYDFLPITDPEIIPIFPAADASTQPITYVGQRKPPLLLLTGTDDSEVRPRNTKALAAATTRVGGSADARYYSGLGHIGLIISIAPVFQWRAPVLRDVMSFVNTHTSSQPTDSVPKP